MAGYSLECRLDLFGRTLACRTSCSVLEEPEYEDVCEGVKAEPYLVRSTSSSVEATLSAYSKGRLQELSCTPASAGDDLDDDEWGPWHSCLPLKDVPTPVGKASAESDDASTEDGDTASWHGAQSEDQTSVAEADDLLSSASADGFGEQLTEEVAARPNSPALSSKASDVSESAGPILTGSWCLSRFEGDMDAIMLDAGYGWTTRKMAKGANYGVGLTSFVVQQDGDRVVIRFSTGLSSHTSELQVGAGEQETVHEDGTPVIAVPRWEGPALIVESRRKDNSAAMQPAKRYLQGEELVVESVSSKGDIVKRFFERTSA
jgi:hypothetical protein